MEGKGANGEQMSEGSEATAMQLDSESLAQPSPQRADGSAAAGSTNSAQLGSERLLFCAEVLIGYKCEVQVSRSGCGGQAGKPGLLLLVCTRADQGAACGAVTASSCDFLQLLAPCCTPLAASPSLYLAVAHPPTARWTPSAFPLHLCHQQTHPHTYNHKHITSHSRYNSLLLCAPSPAAG